MASTVDPRVQAADRLLRRLGVTIKTYSLYPDQHPACVRALEAFNLVLRPYLAAYGPLSVHVSKHDLVVDGTTFHDDTFAHLALYLYTRKLSQVTVFPAVTDRDLSAFFTVVGMDRLSVEAAGGVEHLLWQASVGTVQVVELMLEEDQEAEALGLNAFLALIGRGRLAPREREAVLDILHAPEQAALLLHNVYVMAGEVFPESSPEARVEHTYQAIRTMDRLILDEPLEEQQPLFGALAEAVAQVEAPLRTPLVGTVLAHAAEDTTAALVLKNLSLERLAEILSGVLPAGDIARQLVPILRVLSPGREAAQTLVTLLEDRLRPPGAGATWLRDAVGSQWPDPDPAREPAVPAEFVFDDSQIAIGHEELELRLREAGTIDEAETVREVIKTLVDLLRHETDEGELVDIADTLGAHLAWLLDHQEYGLLASVAGGIRSIALTAQGKRRTLAQSLLQRLTEASPLDRLLAALWAGRSTPVERDLHACFAVLADEAVTPLVRVLGAEPRAGMRALLCDLLVAIGREKIAELGGFTDDDRWYLVRNIANILGRLQNPQVTPHLGRLVRHPEYRVRREAVDALARLGTEEAQAHLVAFLEDGDARIQLRALQALNAWGARRALPRLLAVLEARDPLHRLFGLKQAALEAVERVGAREALPTLQRLAHSPIALGARGRELRTLARRAAAAIEGQRADVTPTGRRQAAGSRP